MKKLKIALLFISFYLLRWLSLPAELPPTWTPESRVRFTATVIEQPEYTDTNTIVRVGVWYVNLRGYAEIIPGSRVSFIGKAEPKLLGNKIVKIVMMDPIFEVVEGNRCERSFEAGCIRIGILNMRRNWVAILEKTLPEPMSSLAAGILLGVKGQMPRDFYDSLVATGTLHIVAASGYNVSIVAIVIMKIMTIMFGRVIAVGCAILGIMGYVLIAGAGASVVRAGIMGSLTLIAYYFGRPAQARRLLWIAAAIMLLFDPLIIFDIGFQLSFVATFGLLYLEPWMTKLHSRSVGALHSGSVRGQSGLDKFLTAYLYPTLEATIATLPIILYQFGKVSYISPLVNILILPIVPMIMAITGAVIGVGVFVPGMAQIIAWVLYPLLWYMVAVIRLFNI
ncbi:MAG: ComEC/Rec2 family competence protein [Microgenomates group bacterium]